MKILYITYIDMDATQTSGSSVRPHKMLDAFKELGHEVIMLSGSAEYIHRKERKKSIRKIRLWLEKNKPDLCYIESSTYPIILNDDRKLIRYIHRLNIPIGYFYRDFYRKFPDLFPRRKGFTNTIKEYILDFLQYKTHRTLRYADIIYLPSDKAKYLFHFRDMRPLPPAGENRLLKEHPYNKTIIYVGGISKHYGGEYLLNAFESLNKENNEYKLILVCRPNEWAKIENRYKDCPWLQCVHASGNELAKLYSAAAAAAIVTKPKNKYNKLAISVKLFEYMSYGLPVIATDNDAMSDIIRKYNIGIVVSSETELARAIKSVLNNREQYLIYCKNVETALLNGNLWTNRAEQVINDLYGYTGFCTKDLRQD